MSNEFFSANDAYKFLKVEDFFSHYKEWEKLEKVTSHSFDQNSECLSLNFTKADGKSCCLLIQFIQKDTFRVRFNPSYESGEQYPTENTRSVVMDSIEELRTVLKAAENFQVSIQESNEQIELKTQGSGLHPSLRMVARFNPFVIEVFGFSSESNDEFRVWQTANPGIYYTPNGAEDYAII